MKLYKLVEKITWVLPLVTYIFRWLYNSNSNSNSNSNNDVKLIGYLHIDWQLFCILRCLAKALRLSPLGGVGFHNTWD